MKLILICSLMVIALLLIAPQATYAYIGPGAGISAIGTVIAFIGSIVLAILAFIWYPIKRSLAKIKQKRMNNQKNTSS